MKREVLCVHDVIWSIALIKLTERHISNEKGAPRFYVVQRHDHCAFRVNLSWQRHHEFRVVRNCQWTFCRNMFTMDTQLRELELIAMDHRAFDASVVEKYG